MCVVALAIGAHPRWPLLLIGNRDEFHARPTAPLARWGDAGGAGAQDHHIIGGRDLQSGGSWLGVSERGRLAVVTNIRSDALPDADKASRGALISDFLRGSGDYAKLREEQLSDFNGFHLITLRAAGDADGVAQHWANRPAPSMRRLSAGVHGFANEAQDVSCPRRARLARQLTAWTAEEGRDPTELFSLLRREEQDAEPGRPNFLNGDTYGTRCSTIVAIDGAGQGRIWERRFGPVAAEQGESEMAFRWG